jgi:hypothetical protein
MPQAIRSPRGLEPGQTGFPRPRVIGASVRREAPRVRPGGASEQVGYHAGAGAVALGCPLGSHPKQGHSDGTRYTADAQHTTQERGAINQDTSACWRKVQRLLMRLTRPARSRHAQDGPRCGWLRGSSGDHPVLRLLRSGSGVLVCSPRAADAAAATWSIGAWAGGSRERCRNPARAADPPHDGTPRCEILSR